MKLLSFLSLAAAVAQAEPSDRWLEISRTDSQVVRADTYSLQREKVHNRDVVTVWFDQRKVNFGLETKAHTRYLMMIDCAAREFAVKSVFTYNYSGDVEASTTTPHPIFSPLPPDSLGELQMAWACGRTGIGPSPVEKRCDRSDPGYWLGECKPQ